MRATTAQALIAKWRAECVRIAKFHATMGTGWKVCADELDAALRAEPVSPMTTVQALKDRERRRYQYADDAMKIVAAIKRDYLPDMDEHDGGEIYSWILDLAEKAARG